MTKLCFPWGIHETKAQLTHFRYFSSNIPIQAKYSSYTIIFPQKRLFSKTLEFDYCVRVDLLDSTKNRKYMHITYQVSCMLSFSARNVLECDFFETRFCFFSRIFWHQNVSVRPPLFSPILDNNMIEHVYIRNM